MPTIHPLPDDPYFILLSRVEKRPYADVWPIPLRSSLPSIPVPLSSGDADVELDLPLVLNTMYDTYAYDLEIVYDASLIRPLSTEDSAWASERIERWKSNLA